MKVEDDTGPSVNYHDSRLPFKTYKPSPTLKRLHESTALFRFVAGPVGSGKTSGALVLDDLFCALRQKVMPGGGRKYKVGVLRDTYRNLYSQYLPSHEEWFPREIGRFVGSDDRPATHTFTIDNAPIFNDQGGVIGYGPIEIVKEMRALGQNTVENVTRGWNLSAAKIDEADLLPEAAIELLAGRAMRYNMEHLVTGGVVAGFNKPDVDHWLYDWCVENPRPDLEFFDQPPGLIPGTMQTNPEADNIERLAKGYYELQARNAKNSYVWRFIRNNWGASVAGEVIYPEFRQDLHVLASELEPTPGMEIVVGLDGGGTPAAVVMGKLPNGRRIIFAEMVIFDPDDPKRQKLQTGVGRKRFAQELKAVLWPRFRGCRITVAYGDPSMWYGADREMGEYTTVEIVGQELDLAVQPAPSNEIAKRLESVRLLIGDIQRCGDGLPALLLNPSCRWLRRGFVSDYKWSPVDPKAPGATVKPQKTATSHVHDALQYACLGDIGVAGVTGGMKYDRHVPQMGHNGGPSMAGWSAVNGVYRPAGGGFNSYGSEFNVFGD